MTLATLVVVSKDCTAESRADNYPPIKFFYKLKLWDDLKNVVDAYKFYT